jgi:hypothetical protein
VAVYLGLIVNGHGGAGVDIWPQEESTAPTQCGDRFGDRQL